MGDLQKSDAASQRAHPIARVAVVYASFGAAFLLLGCLLFVVGAGFGGLLLVALGALAVGLGIWQRRAGADVQRVNVAYAALSQGRIDDARALLDEAERTVRLAYLRRSLDLQGAILAVSEGDLAAAKARLDHAIAAPRSLLAGSWEHMNVASAHAQRAVVHAILGDRAAAEADAKAAQESRWAAPETLGRATIARAIVLERAGDRAALQEHLEQHRTLVDVAPPVERAIGRGLSRALRLPASSVYRRPAPRAQSGSRLSALLAQVSPAAAAAIELADAAGEREAPAPPAEPEAAAMQRVTASRAMATQQGGASTKTRLKRALFIWIALVAVLTLLWFVLLPGAPRQPRPGPPPPSSDSALAFFQLFPLLFVAIFGFLLLEQRSLTASLFTAAREIAIGQTARGRTRLEKIVRTRYQLLAAQAALHLAHLSEREGDLASALRWCDQGIGKLGSAFARAASTDILRPELISERAFVLAAMDRTAEAEAELAVLAREHPTYPFMPRTLFRVRMIQRLRANDLAGAAAIARGRTPELPLTSRDDLLADVVIATDGDDDEARAHLREEVRRFAEGERWMSTVAPAALVAFRERARS